MCVLRVGVRSGVREGGAGGVLLMQVLRSDKKLYLVKLLAPLFLHVLNSSPREVSHKHISDVGEKCGGGGRGVLTKALTSATEADGGRWRSGQWGKEVSLTVGRLLRKKKKTRKIFSFFFFI